MATIELDPETERAARELAQLRGETLERAVSAAVREALGRSDAGARPTRPTDGGRDRLTAKQRAKVDHILAFVRALPDGRRRDGAPDDWLHDENGLPH